MGQKNLNCCSIDSNESSGKRCVEEKASKEKVVKHKKRS